jgi:hypothetical protein
MVGTEFLDDAVDTLEAIATGRAPDRTQALVGAFALNRLSLETEANTGLSSRELRDLENAATALYHIAAGGRWQIDPTAQAHLAELARAVRDLIEAFESSTVH